MPQADETIPACKGCGSRNLRAIAKAVVYCEYDEPLRVDDDRLIFASSYTGDGQGETWQIRCADCDRRMRTNLQPWAEN